MRLRTTWFAKSSLWLLLGLLLGQCQRLPTQRSAACPPAVQLQPGNTRAILLRGTLLLPTGVLANGELLIDTTGRIACVGPDCSTHPAARGASRILAPHGIISPGLINTHDHLAYDHLLPLPISERYVNRQQWRLGQDNRTQLRTQVDSMPARLLWSELRQLAVGTTSIIGIGRASGLLRNLDRDDARLGLEGQRAHYITFPLRNQRSSAPTSPCDYPLFTQPAPTADSTPWIIHVGEGTDQASANEFRCLAGLLPGSQRRLPDHSLLIHALGLSPADARWAHDHELSVVWSPRSNLALYGQTAPVIRYDSLGVNLLLGTDWTPTGSASLPEELRFAAAYNQTHLNGHFFDRQLWQMVTLNAARALQLDAQMGALVVGRWGDVVLYGDCNFPTPYQAVIQAVPATTQLVLRAGQPLYGDADLLQRLPASRQHSERLPLGPGQPAKRVYWPPSMPVPLPEVAEANRNSLPLLPATQKQP